MTRTCEVDYPANAPDALAWAQSQLSMVPSPLEISKSFVSEFVYDKSQLQTFEAERDAVDADPDESGGKARRRPYLWGTTRNTFEWKQPTVRQKKNDLLLLEKDKPSNLHVKAIDCTWAVVRYALELETRPAGMGRSYATLGRPLSISESETGRQEDLRSPLPVLSGRPGRSPGV